jgi:hypothetical protein
VAACAVVAAPLAHADGDPASDILYTQWVFIPFNAPIPKANVDRLKTVVESAKANGYPVKVALIGAPADLGSAFTLWRKPQQYARFLGQELVFLYKGRLLIVMPNGFGFSRGGKPAPAEAAALRGLKVEPGEVGLADSAVTAVARLALPVPPKPKSSSSSMDRVIIGAAAVAGLVLILAFRFRHRVWRLAARAEER